MTRLEWLSSSAVSRSVGINAHSGTGDAVGALDGDDSAVSSNEGDESTEVNNTSVHGGYSKVECG